jgi:hypothetical protein
MCIMTIIAIAENVRLLEICIIRMEIIERYQGRILDEQSHGVSKGEHQFKGRNDLRLFSLYTVSYHQMFCMVLWLLSCQTGAFDSDSLLACASFGCVNCNFNKSLICQLRFHFFLDFAEGSHRHLHSIKTVIILEDDR